MRMLIEMALVLLFPFIVYGIWGWFAVRRGKRRSIWDNAPFKLLSLTGFAFVAGLIAWQASYNKANRYAKWHPPTMVDGKLVPGYFEDVDSDKPPKK